jgi:hypothetical protein
MGDDHDDGDIESTVPWKSLFKSWVRNCNLQRAEIQAGDGDGDNDTGGIGIGIGIVEMNSINKNTSNIGNNNGKDQATDTTMFLSTEDVAKANIDQLEKLVDLHMEASLVFVTSSCVPVVPIRWGPLVRNFLKLLDSVAESCEIDFLADWNPTRELDRCFVYALVWSMASVLKEEDRTMFDEFLRARYDDAEKESTVLQVLPGSVYDTVYRYDLRADRISSCSWVHYEEIVLTEQSRFDQSSNLMIVPTIQHIRARDQYIRFSKTDSVILVGGAASGKSTLLADGIDSRRTYAEMEELGQGQDTIPALSSFNVSHRSTRCRTTANDY